ncbi:unnamed protein product [Rotaria sp. Silwood1]|nr:unnamed protein product [Rotaria sp. Silwood1]CAF3567302.1 unnamed protein product [Rotaria sp. Silwood1]CAF3623315.1 unnamed protein product [Rotaria sp. Silwood1]CAF3626524.1 unnamed protein product [Rotaria sp. Silwood1]CAF4650740.1 unnamed protein product [Rotaria sp. Silwood1]
MCAMYYVTLQQRAVNEFFHISRPTFVIPIFRAPTITSTIKTTINATISSTNKIFSSSLAQEQKQVDTTSTLLSYLNSQRIFENLVLTNTIVAAFCIVLMITLTGFLIFLLIPSIRRRWLNEQKKDGKKYEDISTLSRQPSFHQFTLGPSRLNPLFEPTTGTTQFGTLFHPHTAAATILHPTLWTPMTQTSVISTPVMSQQSQASPAPPPPPRAKTKATTTTPGRPPLLTYPTTKIQMSPRKT